MKVTATQSGQLTMCMCWAEDCVSPTRKGEMVAEGTVPAPTRNQMMVIQLFNGHLTDSDIPICFMNADNPFSI